MSDYLLSVVIPAYNEEKRIGPTLQNILDYLSKQNYKWELIVSDDGSNDQTVNLSRGLLKDIPYARVIEAPRNEGKGSAVRRGMLAAKGKYVLFSDADLSTPIEEWDQFFQYHSKGFDIVIGSRGLQSSNIEIHQGIIRETMGRTFNAIARIVAFKGINDSQCGFKSFTQESAQRLFKLQKLNGFSFDVELMFLAQKLSYKIYEAPVTWRNSEQTRVKIFSDPIKMFADVLKIRWLHRSL